MAMTKSEAELRIEQRIKDISEKIVDIENEITHTKEKLSILEERNKLLYSLLRQEEINLLLETIKARDISLDKAREILNNING